MTRSRVKLILGMTAVSVTVLASLPVMSGTIPGGLPNSGVGKALAAAYQQAMPKLPTNHAADAPCLTCHGNQALVGTDRYVNQTAFKATYHFRKASERLGRDMTCQDCHINSGGRFVARPSEAFVPATDPTAVTNDVSGTCGKCHQDIAAKYRTSLHGTDKGVLASLKRVEEKEPAYFKTTINRSAYDLWAGVDPNHPELGPGQAGHAQCNTCHATCSDCHMTGGNQQALKQLGVDTDPLTSQWPASDLSGQAATGQGGRLGTDYPMNPLFVMSQGMPPVQPDGDPMIMPNQSYPVDATTTATNAIKAGFYPIPMMRGGGSAVLFNGYSPDEARMDIASHNIVLPVPSDGSDGDHTLSRDSSIAMCWRCHARTTPEYVGTFLAFMPWQATKAFGWQTDASPSVHYAAGMVCTDCHKVAEVHGDGTTAMHTDDAVRVRCESCHIAGAQTGGLSPALVSKAAKVVSSHETVECSACHSQWNHNCITCHPVEGQDVNYLDPRHQRPVMALKAIAVTDASGTSFLKYFGRGVDGKVQTMANAAMFDDAGGYWLRGFHSIQRAPDGEGQQACLTCHGDKVRMGVNARNEVRNANDWKMATTGVPEAYVDASKVGKPCSHCHSSDVHSSEPLTKNCRDCHGATPPKPPHR